MKKYMKLLGAAVIASFLFTACDQKKENEAADNKAEATTNTPAALASNDGTVKAKTATTTGEEATGPLGQFKFEEESFDFGVIKQGDKVEHTFKFTNTGEGPLVIADIKASCGCTTPEWPKEPVGPGESGKILVKFNSAGKLGMQNKRITISANVETGRKVISIKTNIEASDDTSTMMGPQKKEKQ